MLESQHNTRAQRRGSNDTGPPRERLVSVRETGDTLGVSDPTVRRLIKKGMLDAVHLSARCLRIRESSILKLMGLAA